MGGNGVALARRGRVSSRGRTHIEAIGTMDHGGGAPMARDTTVYADPDNQLTGTLLTQTGFSGPDPMRLINDFWTTLYQAT